MSNKSSNSWKHLLKSDLNLAFRGCFSYFNCHAFVLLLLNMSWIWARGTLREADWFSRKYENLMRVAQQALANQQYQQAKNYFNELTSWKKALRLIACLFCLYELDEKRSIEASTLAWKTVSSKWGVCWILFWLVNQYKILYARKLIASTDFMKLSSSGSLKNPICRRIIRTNGEAEDQGTPQ